MLKNTKLSEVKRIQIPKAEPQCGDSLSKAMVLGDGLSLDESFNVSGQGTISSKMIEL